MSDNDKKPLGVRGGPRAGHVKQSFSHGRTKSVVVETKRKRVVVPKPGATKTAAPGGAKKPAKTSPSPQRPDGISDAEMERRLNALKAAKANEAEEARRRAEEEREREEERARKKAELEAKEREEREREERARQKAEEEERARKAAEAAADAPPAAAAAPVEPPAPDKAQRHAPAKKTERKPEPERREKPGRDGGDRRRSGKLTLNQALSEDGGRRRSMAAMKRKQERARQKALGGPQQREKVTRDVQVPETIVVSELAKWPSASPTWSRH